MTKVQGKFASLAMAAALATTAATLLSTGAPAAAADLTTQPAPARSAGVRYADLNLASPEGLTRLQDRVRNTAERLCEMRETQTPAANLAAKRCVKRAIAAAAPQIQQAIVRHGSEQFAARAAFAE